MQGKFRWACVSLYALCLSGAANAILSVPDGWYLEPNIGYSRLSNKSYPGSASTSGWAGNVNVGYKFMPYFATEIGYSRYANATIKSGSSNVGTGKFQSYGIAGRGIFPLMATGFELFAKLGVQRITSRTTIRNSTIANNIGLTAGSNSVTGLYIGAGGQYYFMPELAANLQWQRAQGNSSTGTADLYSVGFSVIFD